MRLRIAGDGREFEVAIERGEGGALKARIDGREVQAVIEPLADASAILAIERQRVRVFGMRRGASIVVAAGPFSFELEAVEGRARRGGHGLASPEVVAPMPGKVLQVLVGAGQRVEAGQAMVVMEAMKMEVTLTAERAAIVSRVRVAPGDMVDHGQVLIDLSPPPASSPAQSES